MALAGEGGLEGEGGDHGEGVAAAGHRGTRGVEAALAVGDGSCGAGSGGAGDGVAVIGDEGEQAGAGRVLDVATAGASVGFPAGVDDELGALDGGPSDGVGADEGEGGAQAGSL